MSHPGTVVPVWDLIVVRYLAAIAEQADAIVSSSVPDAATSCSLFTPAGTVDFILKSRMRVTGQPKCGDHDFSGSNEPGALLAAAQEAGERTAWRLAHQWEPALSEARCQSSRNELVKCLLGHNTVNHTTVLRPEKGDTKRAVGAFIADTSSAVEAHTSMPSDRRWIKTPAAAAMLQIRVLDIYEACMTA